jgi:hypothetical protein
MRRWLACLVLALAGAVPAATAAGTDVNLNFYPIAARQMADKDLWDPVDSQYAFGGTIDFARHGAPIHFAIGLHGSIGAKDYTNPLLDNLVGTVSELSFGIAKVWETKGRIRPFISGGASFVYAEIQTDTFYGNVNDHDDALGAWVEGGVYWRIGPHFNFGLHGRYLGGTSIRLFGVDGNADYWQVGPMVGWSWPPQTG